ncbi:MAG: dephospho-CoA kinase [Bacteroidales bacterium]
MYTVGLTGGIGSGKSLVAKIFSHLGIPVFNADAEAGKILEEDLQIRHQLTEWFGPGIYINGRPDRPKLAGIMFTDAEMLSKVNGLIHPRVLDRFINWCSENQNKPYVVHEAAILFESGFYRHMNTTILITAPEKIRISRVKQRDKTTEESIRQRMQNQWTDEQKSPLAGYIIQNDGQSPLIPRILEIHNKLIG